MIINNRIISIFLGLLGFSLILGNPGLARASSNSVYFSGQMEGLFFGSPLPQFDNNLTLNTLAWDEQLPIQVEQTSVPPTPVLTLPTESFPSAVSAKKQLSSPSFFADQITPTRHPILTTEPTLTILPTPPTPSPHPTLPSKTISHVVIPTSPPATPSARNEVSKPTPPGTIGGLNAEKLFEMVNAHRESINLPDFQKDDRACMLAESRAPEINNEIATRTMHKGLRDRNLDYWNTENIISMDSEQSAFNWWIHDKIHKDAIEGDYKYSCMACSGNACAEEFTNFQTK